jgi:hypothetical protein
MYVYAIMAGIIAGFIAGIVMAFSTGEPIWLALSAVCFAVLYAG